MNIIFMNGYKKERSGQVIILATLALGGAILGATTIAGLLMIYQIRQTIDVEDSAKAIFAADTGIEWGQMQFYHRCFFDTTCDPPPLDIPAPPGPFFDPNTSYRIECFDQNVNQLNDCIEDYDRVYYIRSTGISGIGRPAIRALEISFQ